MITAKVLLFAALTYASPIQNENEHVERSASKTPVSAAIYDNMAYYAQYPWSAQIPCVTTPAGIAEQQWFVDNATETQAALFRVDSRQEFVLAFPPTYDLLDYLTDANFLLTAYEASCVTCAGCEVHEGFLGAWNSVSSVVEDGIKEALTKYPNYSVTIVGHSLGAALADLAFGSLKLQIDSVRQLFTYGSPRVGNQAYANYIDHLSGASDSNAGVVHRVTHYNDFAVQLPPTILGYRHHRTEYWESTDNATEATTYRCYGQEPEDCADSLGLDLNTDAHVTYAGQTRFC